MSPRSQPRERGSKPTEGPAPDANPRPLKTLMNPFRLNSITFVLAIASVFILAPEAQAQAPQRDRNFSYTYGQAGGGFVDSSTDADGDVLDGRVVIGVSDYIYLRGEGSRVEFSDLNSTTTTASGAIGYYGDVSETMGFMVDVGYFRSELEVGPADDTIDGPAVAVGLRGMSPERHFEGELRYTHQWFEDLNGSTEDRGAFRFDLVWHATTHFGLYAAGTWDTGNTTGADGVYAFGLRATL